MSLVVASGLVACAASDSNVLDPGPPPGGQQLATDAYKLAPGDEKYMCYTFYSPEDAVAITKVESISAPGVHHLVVYQTFGGEAEQDGEHECPVLIKLNWMPIWASGTGSKEMVLPDAVGFKIKPATQYVVQVHMQNSTDEEMTIRTGINFSYDHAPDTLTAAGLYALGTFKLDIPAKTNDYQFGIDCMPNKTMNVFTVFPHMHKIGTKLEVTRTAAGSATAAPFYTIDPWRFGDQPMDPLATKVEPGDSLHATCHYDNKGDTPVTYGESSDNEMCFFVMFYYPFDSLAGCLES